MWWHTWNYTLTMQVLFNTGIVIGIHLNCFITQMSQKWNSTACIHRSHWHHYSHCSTHLSPLNTCLYLCICVFAWETSWLLFHWLWLWLIQDVSRLNTYQLFIYDMPNEVLLLALSSRLTRYEERQVCDLCVEERRTEASKRGNRYFLLKTLV